MKIKTKLQLGFSFLFLIYLFLGGIALWYIHQLSDASTKIVKNNHETLQYMQSLIKYLDGDKQVMNAYDRQQFNKVLNLQEKNITETGEKEATSQIHTNFNTLQRLGADKVELASAKQKIRSAIFTIMELNNKAILKKNDLARQTAHNATLFVSVMATFCFLIVFSLIVNFPSYLTDTIHELKEGICEIANKNYKYRVDILSNDEFGELSVAFNSMARQLEEYENNNLAKIQFDKLNIEIIIKHLNDAVIGFDESNRVLFVNPTALMLLGLKEDEIAGKTRAEVAGANDLLYQLLNEEVPAEEFKINYNGKESYFSKEVYHISVPNSNLDEEEQTIMKSEKYASIVILLKKS